MNKVVKHTLSFFVGLSLAGSMLWLGMSQNPVQASKATSEPPPVPDRGPAPGPMPDSGVNKIPSPTGVGSEPPPVPDRQPVPGPPRPDTGPTPDTSPQSAWKPVKAYPERLPKAALKMHPWQKQPPLLWVQSAMR
ncbi:MAG: hypothetical protein EP343_30570 [Deltaproteobacteria bacterium]|nr:MAG: hypothetical protein EP343_30570 [Deltaproteobacteria bacterium]